MHIIHLFYSRPKGLDAYKIVLVIGQQLYTFHRLPSPNKYLDLLL